MLPIIKKLRADLESAFVGLEFNEELHKYWIFGKSYTSVSGLISQMYEHFDVAVEAPKFAKRHGLDLAQVEGAWAGENLRAVTEGSRVHIFAEDYANVRYLGYEDPLPVCKSKQDLAVVRWWDNLPDGYHPVIMELQMYNVALKYCGTADIILADVNDLDHNGRPKIIIADYKGLPLHTPVLTTTGWETMETLTKKSIVYDKSGFPTRIKGLSEVHNKPCLKITYDNGETIVADEDHRWDIANYKDPVTTKQMLEEMAKGSELLINNPRPLSRHSTLDHIPDRSIMYLIYGDLALPWEYLKSNLKSRWALLADFISVIGGIDSKQGVYYIETPRELVKNSFLMLLGSLGLKPFTSKVPRKVDGIHMAYHRVVFHTPECFFRDVQIPESDTKLKYPNARRVVEVTPVKSEPTRCIEVESASHTFLYGHTLIPTHNTNKDIEGCFGGKKMYEPMSHLPDSNLGHYTCQFSFYQIMLEKAGFTVKGRVLVWLQDDKENWKPYKNYKTSNETVKLLEWLEKRAEKLGDADS